MLARLPLFPKTIRSQVIVAFSACFLFMAVMIAVNYNNFHLLSGTMQFFQLAEDLNSSILEMRRYEKNYFLFAQDFNYEENLTYTNRLSMMLQREKDNLTEAIGKQNFSRFEEYLLAYSKLMATLRKTPRTQGCCVELMAEIRKSGQNLLLLADHLVNTERREINNRIRKMVSLPIINLGLLIILLVFIVFFIGEKIVRPLARITRESEQIARGAYLRITPFGVPGNEIHGLITAVNYMMNELESRQDQLVQSRKIAAVGTLTSGIAHELNNPVNNISLILESLIEDGGSMDPSERLRLYKDAMDQTDRASETVKNLLEFSRASHPKVEVVSLEELVDKTARLVNNELRLNKIKFTKDIQEAIPSIQLDRSGIQQVLLNLFINSIQAMPEGGELQATIRFDDISEGLTLEIKDTGEGIPAEHMDSIFDPFFTTKKEGEGTGLGLSVSYNIIKKHGGRINVESKLGQGTCFSIYLPVGIKDVLR